MIWACAITSLVFACPWMARHRLMFNQRHKGFSSWEQNELEGNRVQAVCYSVSSATAVANPWIKRCFSQQIQTRLMASLMMAIVMSYYWKVMELKYREQADVEDGVAVLEAVAVLFLQRYEHYKMSYVQSTLQTRESCSSQKGVWSWAGPSFPQKKTRARKHHRCSTWSPPGVDCSSIIDCALILKYHSVSKAFSPWAVGEPKVALTLFVWHL